MDMLCTKIREHLILIIDNNQKKLLSFAPEFWIKSLNFWVKKQEHKLQNMCRILYFFLLLEQWEYTRIQCY